MNYIKQLVGYSLTGVYLAIEIVQEFIEDRIEELETK